MRKDGKVRVGSICGIQAGPFCHHWVWGRFYPFMEAECSVWMDGTECKCLENKISKYLAKALWVQLLIQSNGDRFHQASCCPKTSYSPC